MWDMCEVEREEYKKKCSLAKPETYTWTVNFINISNNYEPLKLILWSNRKKEQIQYDITYIWNSKRPN